MPAAGGLSSAHGRKARSQCTLGSRWAALPFTFHEIPRGRGSHGNWATGNEVSVRAADSSRKETPNCTLHSHIFSQQDREQASLPLPPLPRPTPLRMAAEMMPGPKQTAEPQRGVTPSRATSWPLFRKPLAQAQRLRCPRTQQRTGRTRLGPHMGGSSHVLAGLPGQRARAAQPALALSKSLTLPSGETKRHQGSVRRLAGRTPAANPTCPQPGACARAYPADASHPMSPTAHCHTSPWGRVLATAPQNTNHRLVPNAPVCPQRSSPNAPSRRSSASCHRSRSGSRQIAAHPGLLSRDHTPDCPPGHTFGSGRAWGSPGHSRACVLITLGRTAPAPRFQRRSRGARKKRSPALLSPRGARGRALTTNH